VISLNSRSYFNMAKLLISLLNKYLAYILWSSCGKFHGNHTLTITSKLRMTKGSIMWAEGLRLILLISPTKCTILRNIFISLLCMFRASMCPSSGENHSIYATLVLCYSVWLASGLQTGSQPNRVTQYHCRIDTVIISWW